MNMTDQRRHFVSPLILLASLSFISSAGYAQTSINAPFSSVIPGNELAESVSDCTRTSVGLTPLSDLVGDTYRGYEGGLYLGGANQPPLDYRWMGRARASHVQPLNQNGQPDPNGRIVLLSIGMSNTTQEFSTFKSMADADPQKNPRLTIVDGAQGGQDAETIRNPNAPFWANVDQRLAAAGVSRNQVQTAWLKEAIAGENRPFPNDAIGLRDALRDIVGIMQTRYPNLQ